MLFHQLRYDTIESFLTIDCIAVNATRRIEQREDAAEWTHAAKWILTIRIRAVIVDMNACAWRRKRSDVHHHLLKQLLDAGWLRVEGLRAICVARIEVTAANVRSERVRETGAVAMPCIHSCQW